MVKKVKKRKKRKLKIGRILIALLVLIISITAITKLASHTIKNINIKEKEYYVAAKTNTINVYSYNSETDQMEVQGDIIRGKKVKSNDKIKTVGEETYNEIKIDDKTVYILESNLSEDEKTTVQETEKYVRTSVTVYSNEKDSQIESFIKKGNKIEILDYDYVDDSGNVNMYKIKKDEVEGWVYQKYLVDTEEESKANYNENNVYDTHKNRKYSYELYGGKASTLDYYPNEKKEYENNPLLKEAKTMYLNGGVNVIPNIDTYIELAKSSGVNAMVVDIKDGALAYPVSIAEKYSPTSYKSAMNSFDTYKTAIDKIKDAGIYVIGRIVVFNDSQFAKDHPEDCIQNTNWVSAYSRLAWQYNVELSIQAIKDMGFNEIQFDYVRFPESSYAYSKNNYDFKNKYSEEKAEAIQNFLIYATDQIHKEEVYLSADVFGECSGTYVTAYGQYWPAISNVVDVISSMPYTDHFDRNVDTWSNPYQTIYNWAKGAAERQKEIPTPAVARTWITAYDTPFWKPTVVYDAKKISDQAQALVDAGLNGGFITWNSSSNINKYRQIKDAFTKEYKNQN